MQIQIPGVERMDSREGFAKGDRVRRAGGPGGLPEDGVVNGWLTFEYGPRAWYCCVTWGGRYIGRYQANEIEHADQPK
ncbi:hypothetical protein [Streptomyces sp. CB03238]|uniref:hypothetical protein n=1 Tax=Streptomyces sp. CB03238 TaxID=1907777 RepID=UPI000A10D1E6|nr:hypothetical protein [Streptomyces sp. CB03238]ORT54615.1 hypothetical protein BKD26_34540 [Streptomyces sp. CB03238]